MLSLTDLLALFTFSLFTIAQETTFYDRGVPLEQKALHTASWVSFLLFWIALIPGQFASGSIIEGLLIIAAIPALLRLIHANVARDEAQFTSLHRLVLLVGGSYLIVYLVPGVQQTLVELVTQQTAWALRMLGFEPTVFTGPNTFESGLSFQYTETHTLQTHIEVACTGLGSMAVFVGLLLYSSYTTENPVALLLPFVVYVLNLVRNIFIAAAYAGQWFHIAPELVLDISGYSSPFLTSFFIADKLIGQAASILVLVVLVFVSSKLLPDTRDPVYDSLYLLTGSETYRTQSVD